MVIVKQQCLSNNGSSLFINVSQIDNSSSVIVNKSVTGQASSTLRPDWEVSYELMYGPNVSCTTQQLELPRDLRFTDDTMISVVAYCCMFLMSLVGNIMVFTTLWGGRRSRVNMCILHLSVADLYVACVFLPLETTWHITVSWQAGDLACRICMLLRAFGFYLSSYITVVIAIDRYMSIVHPLVFHGSFKRCKFMLASAYVISFFFSLPQSIIFHVEYHPVYSWFSQCVTFNFFESDFHELAYDIFSCAAVYVTPLFIMVVMYTRIFVKLSHQQYKHEVRPMLSSRHLRRWKHNCLPIHTQLRCSRANYLYKAKLRTLKMTLCIVCVFILCWTPYFFMILYHWLAKDVAVQMDSKIKRVLFIFAVSSSCLDPLVYGMFTSTFHRKFKKWREYFNQKFNAVHSTTIN